MFKEILTSIGFGNAKVDTIVKKKVFSPEEQIAGIVALENLSTSDIDRIELTLIERKDNTDETSDFHTLDIEISKVIIQNDDIGEIPFIFESHDDIEDYTHQFFIMTHVFVNHSVDYYDEDEIYFERPMSS